MNGVQLTCVIGQAPGDPCGRCVRWGVLMAPATATCSSVLLLLRVIRRRGAMLVPAISAGTAGRQGVQSRKVLSRRTACVTTATLRTCSSLIDHTESVHRNTVVIMVVVMMMRIINKARYPKQASNKVRT